MEKYGVLHEYKCDCGYCVIIPDNDYSPQQVKTAGMEEHVHTLKKVEEENGHTEGSDFRPVEHSGTV